MHRSLRTAIIAIILAIAFTVLSFSLPSLLAAENLKLGSFSAINYQVFPPAKEQIKELGNLGLTGKENSDGSVTLEGTTNFGDKLSAVNGKTMASRHSELINQGVLRYAIYNGALCQQASAGLIIILDFTNFNITNFQANFLTELTYVLLGSGEFWGTGKTFTEKNYDGGALTVYDSSNGGAVVTNKYNLTLQGMFADNKDGSANSGNSYITDANGNNKTILSHYSIRIILPRNPKTAVTLESKSLTLEGFDFLGFTPKQPDCIGLGISHLDIDPKNHASSIIINSGAATTMHFHWVTTTNSQMQFALLRSLDNMLGINGASADTGYVDEIFAKPNALSDFSHLYLRSEKLTDGAAISVYDSPNAEISTSQSTAAAVRLCYWLERVYGLKAQNVNNVSLELRRYQRANDNTISDTYTVLSCDTNTKYTHMGETCYAVYEKADNGAGASAIIGYFSESGKLYNADWKPTAA